MLKKFPEIGERVISLVTRKGKSGVYKKKDSVYRIKGKSSVSDLPYFIGDDGDTVCIDEGAFDEYVLYEVNEKEYKTSIKITGSSINAWNYREDTTDFTLDFQMATNAGLDTLKVIDEFQEDVAKLIEEKYSN